MIKNIIIAVLLVSTVSFGLIAYRNSKPVCDDLVRYPKDETHQLICEYGLGDVPASKANVIMRYNQ